MSEPWTQQDRKTGRKTPLGWGLVVGLGVVACALLGYTVWRITTKVPDTTSIVGEWQAIDPPWRAVFRPDKTVGMYFDGPSAPASLAPLVMTPGVEVPGRYTKEPEGVFQIRLQNGKNYEATIGKYVSDRFDLTDAEGASAVLTFEKVTQPGSNPVPAEP